MANEVSPRGRAGGIGRRCCGALTRVDLLTFLLAAALCSASYCLGVWHNSRGATDSRVLGPSAALASPATSCAGDSDEPLDFEARHAAEGAGLSVSTSTSATTTTTATPRRALLRGAAPGSTEPPGGKRWAAPARADGGSLRFTDAQVSVQA